MSSFRKRVPSKQPKLPPGTKLSPHNGQVLVSTGVPSLDDVLGGGLPVGSICLVLADRRTGYSNMLLNYFMAQGLAAGHQVHLASADTAPEDLLKAIPSWCPEVAQDTAGLEPPASPAATTTTPEAKMKIAWRYQNLPSMDAEHDRHRPVGPHAANLFCHSFDLLRPVRPNALESANIDLLDLSTWRQRNLVDPYEALLAHLCALIEDQGFSSLGSGPVPAERNVLRVAIHALASPFWQGQNPNACVQFLHALKGLLRYSFSACMITMPAHLYQTDGPHRSGFIRQLEHMCDAVVELESFTGSRSARSSAPSLNCHGFFYIHKQPLLNSLVPSSSKLSIISGAQLSANNLAFKQKRHKFVIETFHLPPEGGVSERRVEPLREARRKSERPQGSNPHAPPSSPAPLLDF
ncbi:Elongator subunit elp4 [Dimargaris xerosporica]|nr:Elongator subunit elp4 [Dimargaris xerosporica]